MTNYRKRDICRAAFLGYNGTEAVPLEKRLWVVPLRMLLS